jgi:hypothetical protein
MPEQIAAPIIPNLGAQAESISGSQGVIFTATDRQIIKERAGDIDPSRSFKEIFTQRDLTPKVENEQSTVNPEQDLRAMESRRREHRRMLKYSALATPHEHVELSGAAEEETVVMTPPEVSLGNRGNALPAKGDRLESKAGIPTQEVSVKQEAPAAEFDRIAAEQSQLNNLLSKIKELHFKRVLCDNEADFERISEEIKQATLAGSQPEAKSYLEAKVDAITKTTAEYKLRLLLSLESIHYDEHDKNVQWLQKMIGKYTR